MVAITTMTTILIGTITVVVVVVDDDVVVDVLLLLFLILVLALGIAIAVFVVMAIVIVIDMATVGSYYCQHCDQLTTTVIVLQAMVTNPLPRLLKTRTPILKPPPAQIQNFPIHMYKGPIHIAIKTPHLSPPPKIHPH